MNLNLNGVAIQVSDADVLEMLRQRIMGSPLNVANPGMPLAANGAAHPLASNRPRLGDYWQGQGGIYVGDIIGDEGQSPYSLIVPTDPRAQVNGMAWGGRGVDEKGAMSDYDGLANTIALAQSTTEHPIAKWARGLTIEGHNDFYVFARNEARLCHVNGRGLFNKEGWYWTSTQVADDADWAWLQGFVDGRQDFYGKVISCWVCAVRRVNHLLIQ